MSILLLAAPYGDGEGDSISLRCPQGEVHTRMEEVLAGYSCHPPALPKIRSCLEHSGRYDCIVQPYWFRKQAGMLENELEEIGIELKVLNLTDAWNPPPLDKGFRGERP